MTGSRPESIKEDAVKDHIVFRNLLSRSTRQIGKLISYISRRIFNAQDRFVPNGKPARQKE